MSTETSLRQVIAERPKNGRARAELALLLHQQSKEIDDTRKNELLLEAIKLADESIAVAPNKPFGLVAKSILIKDHDKRMSATRQALIVLKEMDSFRTTRIELLIRLLIEPRRHCHEMRRELNKEESLLYKEIVDALKEATPTDSDCTSLGQSNYHLGTLFRKMNPLAINQPRSRHHFDRAIRLFPDNHPSRELATFWLATLQTDNDKDMSLSKCPPDYIVGLYSSFAERFDDLLVTKLSYQTPTLLRNLVNEAIINTDKTTNKWAKHAADLGCGTGLSGMAFCDITQELIGVDLSPEMIAKARLRDCYDELVVGDVTDILTHCSKYDFVFSCDVFVYLGDLRQVFDRVHESLCKDGVFAFSTELLKESQGSKQPYKLHECARFAHKQSYILGLAQEYDFVVLKTRVCTIRKNKGNNVSGFLVVLRKSSTPC